MQGFAPLFRMITDRIEAFLADRGYDADAIREEIEAAGVEAVIPAKVNRRNPAPHDRAKYKWRNLIERLFNKLKNWRRVATRYDKTKESYLGFVALASVKLWIPLSTKPSNRPNGKQALLRAMKRARTLPRIAAPAGAYEREVSDADMKNPGSARAFRRKL